MIVELLLIMDLLKRKGLHQTPQSVSGPPASVSDIFGRGKSRTASVSPPVITLGQPKSIAEVMQDLPPQRIEDITIPERYYRRPKGLN